MDLTSRQRPYFDCFLKRRYPVIFILLAFMVVHSTALLAAGMATDSQRITQNHLPTKKEKRLKRILKKLEAIPSKTKGILALGAGILSVASVLFSIAMSFALSVPGVVIGIVLGALFGSAALVLGIQAIKEAAGGQGFGIAGIIIGGIGLLMLLILSLGSLIAG